MDRRKIKLAFLGNKHKAAILEIGRINNKLDAIEQERIILSSSEVVLRNALSLEEAIKIEIEHDIGRVKNDR